LQAAGASELVSEGISSLRGEFNSQDDEWEKKLSSHLQHRTWSALFDIFWLRGRKRRFYSDRGGEGLSKEK
jgi:hypothetical protein